MRFTLIALFIASPLLAAEPPDRFTPGAPNASDAVETFTVPDGFVVELVAAEPLVMDPVAFAWGPDGRLWVVEMSDYNWLPMNDDSPDKPKGRVVYLTDSDGDGKYDKRHVFLDDLNYPNGVMPWRNGVLITAAPDILYAEDTTPNDGNDKADKREVLFTGFNEGNPQLRVNGLAWGLDGWVYCANGFSNGEVKSIKTGKTLDIRNRDLRIRPDTGEMEPATGPSQFGRVRDDFGNWFGCNNSDLIRHYVLADHYLRRNPHFTPPDPVISLVQPRNPPLFDAGTRVARFHADYMAGRFTSACGLHLFRDTLLDHGDDVYYHNAFICEPVHNLVTRRVLVPDGVTFKAVRAKGEEQREWMTSTDNWFRPAMVRTGPDGAIWIADMYRAVIEHAQWAPKEVHETFAKRHGKERGRIWRVYRKDVELRATPRLDKLDLKQLAAAIDTPNGYQRDLAQMLFAWRDELGQTVREMHAEMERRLQAGAPLDDDFMGHMATVMSERYDKMHPIWKALRLLSAQAESPAVRTQALSMLANAKMPDAAAYIPAMFDQHPAVRRFAIQMGLEFDDAGHQIRLNPTLWRVVDDRDVTVRLQAALSLGDYEDPLGDPFAGALLAKLLFQHTDDEYVSAAVLSSAPRHMTAIVDGAFGKPNGERELSPPTIDALTATLVARSDDATIAQAMSRIAAATNEDQPYSKWQMRAMVGLLEALAKKGRTLVKMVKGDDDALKTAANKAWEMVDWVSHPWHLDKLSVDEQVLAVRLYGLSGGRDPLVDLALSAFLHRPDCSYELRRAAAEFFAVHGPGPSQRDILKRDTWTGLTPALRGDIVALMLRRTSRISHLLDRVEAGDVNRFDISAAHREQLVKHKDASIRQRAAKLLGEVETDRAKVVKQFESALKLTGDVERGRAHFTKTCAVCHQIAGDAHGLAKAGAGPDLGALTDQSPRFLLSNILDPNRAVDSRYLNYIADTADGDVLTGMLATETAGGITLVGADGTRHDIARTELDKLRSSGKSIMPEGLEQQLGEQGLADVIAYVRHRAVPPRALAGVKARAFSPDANGQVVLDVRGCEPFGRAITYEKSNNNLGDWTRGDDYVAWTVRDLPAGEYDVFFDYACDPAWKGNTFVLSVRGDGGAGDELAAPIEPTANARRYEQRKMGRVVIDDTAAGTVRVMLRAKGKVNGELMRLRGVRLVRAQ